MNPPSRSQNLSHPSQEALLSRTLLLRSQKVCLKLPYTLVSISSKTQSFCNPASTALTDPDFKSRRFCLFRLSKRKASQNQYAFNHVLHVDLLQLRRRCMAPQDYSGVPLLWPPTQQLLQARPGHQIPPDLNILPTMEKWGAQPKIYCFQGPRNGHQLRRHALGRAAAGPGEIHYHNVHILYSLLKRGVDFAV